MRMKKTKCLNNKEEKTMAVSMAVVPLLKGNAAKSIIDDFKASQIQNYSDIERKKTNDAVAKILKQRTHSKNK